MNKLSSRPIKTCEMSTIPQSQIEMIVNFMRIRQLTDQRNEMELIPSDH